MDLAAPNASLALTIASAAVGFVVGAYATYRLAPPLAPAGSGRLAALTVCGLVGAAVGLAAMNVYLAIEAWRFASGAEAQLAGLARVSVVDSLVFALAQSGVLLALAAVVHLLTPGGRAVEG